MKFFHSESPADERKLHRAKEAQSAAESELQEVDAAFAIVDRLIGEQLAAEAEARTIEVRAEGGQLVQGQADAVAAFAETFAGSFAEQYATYAASTAALGSHFANNRASYGERPPFALDPLPVTYRSLFETCHRALEREWIQTGQLTPAVLTDSIPRARDEPLDVISPNTKRV
jgi:hypothetical protein